MPEYIWMDNTQQIYDKACKLAPKPFQEITRKSLNEALEKRLSEGDNVTEEILIECIKEITPKPFFALGMRKIKPLLKNYS